VGHVRREPVDADEDPQKEGNEQRPPEQVPQLSDNRSPRNEPGNAGSTAVPPERDEGDADGDDGATSRPLIADPRGCASWVMTNGTMTGSASLGPIRTRIASSEPAWAFVAISAPPTWASTCSTPPIVIVAGTSESRAKNAIAAACPLARCRIARRSTDAVSEAT
jgi:hypothetical protein